MQTDAVVAKATRFLNKREGDAIPGLVIVEFGSVADKKVFRARGKLAGCNVGLDDDLTTWQQKQKAAAWDKFKEARAGNLKTRWEGNLLGPLVKSCTLSRVKNGWRMVCALTRNAGAS